MSLPSRDSIMARCLTRARLQAQSCCRVLSGHELGRVDAVTGTRRRRGGVLGPRSARRAYPPRRLLLPHATTIPRMPARATRPDPRQHAEARHTPRGARHRPARNMLLVVPLPLYRLSPCRGTPPNPLSTPYIYMYVCRRRCSACGTSCFWTDSTSCSASRLRY